ncbi:MAG: RagB/SusD family nutrient uptake outer membrane protein [Proteiniphilum sp.]
MTRPAHVPSCCASPTSRWPTPRRQVPPDLPLEEFRERVYRERIYEMAYEADRMYDIRRWGRIGEIKEVVDAGLTESQYSFYPIPQSEINLNPSLR